MQTERSYRCGTALESNEIPLVPYRPSPRLQSGGTPQPKGTTLALDGQASFSQKCFKMSSKVLEYTILDDLSPTLYSVRRDPKVSFYQTKQWMPILFHKM
jgi:hypothetical protein